MSYQNVEFVKTDESDYNSQASEFINNHQDSIAVKNNYTENHSIIDSDFNSQIKNKYPCLDNFYKTFSNVDMNNYVNKSLVVIDQSTNSGKPNVIKNILLHSKPQKNTRELYLTDINNVIFPKDESINSFKFKYDAYLKNSADKHKTDIITPNFNKTNNVGHNSSKNKSTNSISDILLMPVIQFPKVFEYIKLHENRELIEFLMKYLTVYNSFDGSVDNNYKHFYTICLLVSKKDRGIYDGHPIIKYLKEIADDPSTIKYEAIDNYRFNSILDPFTKFPQIIKINEFDLKQLFGKLNKDFKNDYIKIENFIKTIGVLHEQNHVFLEHFLKISLLLKFIVSQIINVTYKFECRNYNKDIKKSEIIEYPDTKEFEILNTLISKVLGLRDSYTVNPTIEILHVNRNMIFKKSTSQNVQVQSNAGKKVVPKGGHNADGYAINGFNNLYNPSVDGALDPAFFINWIVPVLNRFFRIHYELPNFYKVNKFGIENFNASFKNEHYVTMLGFNVYSKLMLDDPKFLQKSKIDYVFLIGSSANEEVFDNVTKTYFFKDSTKRINEEHLSLWRDHLLKEIEILKKENIMLNATFEQKMEDVDLVRFNKIPNLINGKFDNELMSIDGDYMDKAKLFLEKEVTSHDNKEMNTKSLYYKYFQDESSVTNDMNVKTLTMRLEKCYEQVSVLEKRLEELKNGKEIKKDEGSTNQTQDYETLKDELKNDDEVLTGQLYDLQEKYKDKSNQAFTKATSLTQLKDYLKSREKYLEVLTVEEKKVTKNKEKLEKSKNNVTMDNYNSLLALLKSKHSSLLENK